MSTSRIPLMASVAAILGALVLADRAGVLPGSASAETDVSSPASRFAALAQADQEETALLSQAGSWRQAAERAENEWRRASAGLVRAATAELAETRFREIVKGAIQDVPLVSPERIVYIRDAAAARGNIQTLRLSVEFDAHSARDAYTIIDRLEHLPDARARIEQFKVEGPGRIQAPEQVTVTLTLSAAALIGGEEAP